MTDRSQRTSRAVALTAVEKKAQHACSRAARSLTQPSSPGSARNRNVMPASDRSRPIRKPLNSLPYSSRRSAGVSGAEDMSHTIGGRW